MKIDERALEVAANVYAQSILGVPIVGLDTHRSEVIVEAMRSALEAYEGAKPSPWMPIEEARREGETGDWILAHWYASKPIGGVGSINLIFWSEICNAWCEAGGESTYTHEILVDHGAQFRTIDPPS